MKIFKFLLFQNLLFKLDLWRISQILLIPGVQLDEGNQQIIFDILYTTTTFILNPLFEQPPKLSVTNQSRQINHFPVSKRIQNGEIQHPGFI